jgi:pyruvate-ferredoxin/flavodoxin oxidoreductase
MPPGLRLLQEGAGSEALRAALSEWLPGKDSGLLAGPAAKVVAAALAAEGADGAEGAVAGADGAGGAGAEALRYLKANTDLLDKPSVWIVGGDGWAYDVSAF